MRQHNETIRGDVLHFNEQFSVHAQPGNGFPSQWLGAEIGGVVIRTLLPEFRSPRTEHGLCSKSCALGEGRGGGWEGEREEEEGKGQGEVVSSITVLFRSWPY